MNIVLIGIMGTGKTATGKALAAKLGWQFFDTDEMIEKEAGMTVSEIFARRGEACFRDMETQAIRLLSVLDKTVIACGGGAVLRRENMDELERNGVIVCLSAAPEVIVERVRKSGNRPLLKVADPLAKIRELERARSEFYRRCHVTIDTGGRDVAGAAAAIIESPAVAAMLKA